KDWLHPSNDQRSLDYRFLCRNIVVYHIPLVARYLDLIRIVSGGRRFDRLDGFWEGADSSVVRRDCAGGFDGGFPRIFDSSDHSSSSCRCACCLRHCRCFQRPRRCFGKDGWGGGPAGGDVQLWRVNDRNGGPCVLFSRGDDRDGHFWTHIVLWRGSRDSCGNLSWLQSALQVLDVSRSPIFAAAWRGRDVAVGLARA